MGTFSPLVSAQFVEEASVRGYVTYLMLVLQEWRPRCIVDRFLWRRVMAFFFYEPFVKLLLNDRAKKLEGFHGFSQASILYVMGIDMKGKKVKIEIHAHTRGGLCFW